MLKLYESKNFILEHEYEDVYLTSKRVTASIFMSDFYGDAHCGLISKDEKWCLVGGSTFLLWDIEASAPVDWVGKDLIWIEDIRQIDTCKFQILTDPWSKKSTIWEINVKDKTVCKVQNFTKYLDTTYTENIDW